MRAVTDGKPSCIRRKIHTKVKTGCITCRIRRVKCDEKRPSCLKCTNTGRTCDGYTQSQVRHQTQVASSTQTKSLWPSKALAILPDFGDDVRYLEFYYHCLGPKLSGRFDTEFWTRTILQMAHAEPGVRNALIALGHLNQRQSGSLQHARQFEARHEDLERKFFFNNYNKAIRNLIDHMTKPSFSAEVALVVCLLFACIEFLRADASMAFTHIRSGLNIVHESRRRNLPGFMLAAKPFEAGQCRGQVQSTMVEQILVPMLTQALASALPYGTSLENDFVFLESCPRYFEGVSFTCLGDARSSFFDLRDAAILLARDVAVKLYRSIPLTLYDFKRRDDLLEHHRIWLRTLQALEGSRKSSEKEDLNSVSALMIGYYSSYTACACIMDESQMSFDAHLADFRSLVRHVNMVVYSAGLHGCRGHASSTNAVANFAFETSLVPALFYTAIRCRCPTTRREAVGLLALDLPREGLWDPEQHRIVAERVIEIEELEVDARGWPKQSSRLCRSCVGTDVDANLGFEATFLYTKDLAMASERTWNERLVLGERVERSLPIPIIHAILQQP